MNMVLLELYGCATYFGYRVKDLIEISHFSDAPVPQAHRYRLRVLVTVRLPLHPGGGLAPPDSEGRQTQIPMCISHSHYQHTAPSIWKRLGMTELCTREVRAAPYS